MPLNTYEIYKARVLYDLQNSRCNYSRFLLDHSENPISPDVAVNISKSVPLKA